MSKFKVPIDWTEGPERRADDLADKLLAASRLCHAIKKNGEPLRLHLGSLQWTSSRPVMEASVQAALVACLVSVDRIIAVMGWDPTPWNLWKPEVGEAFP